MTELTALLTREELLGELEQTEGLDHRDVDLGTTQPVEFQEVMQSQPARVNILGEEYPLTDEALYQIASCVGIPAPYARRCPYYMLRDHLNYWCGRDGKVRFFLKDRKVIGAYDKRYTYYSNYMLHDNVLAGVGDTEVLGYHQVSTDLNCSRFSVVLNKTFDPVPGDTLFGGISIQNSVLGSKALEVTPYIFRQWCSNGEIVTENLSKWSRRSNNTDDIAVWTQGATARGIRELDNEFDRIRHLVEANIGGQLESTLKSLFRKFHIPTRTQAVIRGEAEKQNEGEGSKTMYDIWNAFTAVGTHSQALSEESCRELQIVAGEITKDYAMCDKCHQVIL